MIYVWRRKYYVHLCSKGLSYSKSAGRVTFYMGKCNWPAVSSAASSDRAEHGLIQLTRSAVGCSVQWIYGLIPARSGKRFCVPTYESLLWTHQMQWAGGDIMRASFAVVLSIAFILGVATDVQAQTSSGQHQPRPKTDAELVQNAMSGAPGAISRDATIIAMDGDKARTLQQGKKRMDLRAG